MRGAVGGDGAGQLAGSGGQLVLYSRLVGNLWRVLTVFKAIPLAAECIVVQRPAGGQVSGLDWQGQRWWDMDWSAIWGHALL